MTATPPMKVNVHTRLVMDCLGIDAATAIEVMDEFMEIRFSEASEAEIRSEARAAYEDMKAFHAAQVPS